jgi:hypothetical protein
MERVKMKTEPLEVAGPKTTLRLVKMESALRIIITLSAFSSGDDEAKLRACMREIARTAKEGLQ